MTPIDRNPDIIIGTDPMPEGCYLHEGLNLMKLARPKGIPFGVARKIVSIKNKTGWSGTQKETVGIIVRTADKDRMNAAIEARKEKLK